MSAPFKTVEAFLGKTKFVASEDAGGNVCIARTSADGKVTLCYVPRALFDAHAIHVATGAFEALLREKLR